MRSQLLLLSPCFGPPLHNKTASRLWGGLLLLVYMGEWAVVALNVRPEARKVEVAMPEFVGAESAQVALSTEGGEATIEGGKMALNIPAYGYVIVNE